MGLYKEQTIQDSGAHSLHDLKPRSLGKVLQPKEANEDLLGEMVLPPAFTPLPVAIGACFKLYSCAVSCLSPGSTRT